MSRWLRWSRRLLPDRRALAAAGLYAGFGAAWIFWSDRLLFDRSSDLPVVQLLGQWKGLAFVALSAAVVYGVARRRRPLRGRAAAAAADGNSTRLLALLGLAALLIVSLGVVGSVTALNGQREDTAHLLRTLAAARAEQWGTWLREQQAAASRWDPTLPQLVERARAAPAEPAASQALDAHLRALCLGARCVDARLLAPSASGRLDAPLLEPVSGLGDPTVSGALLSVARPVYLGADTPRGALVLRFDALAALVSLLRHDGASPADGPHLALVRPSAAGQQVIRLGPQGAPVLQPLAPDAALPLPAAGGAPGEVPPAFEAHWPGGTPFFAVATGPDLGGWSLVAWVDRGQMFQRVWRGVLWTAAGALAVLVVAGLGAFGLQQHRALLAARRERASQQARMRALGLLDAMAAATPDALFACDLQGRLLFANRAAQRVLGTPGGGALGACGCSGTALAAMHAQAVQTGELVTNEGELDTPEGPRWFARTLGPLKAPDGSLHGVFGALRDVTERRRQEEGSRLWAQAFQNTRDGVVICNAQGRIERINRAFTEITGYSEAEVVGRTPAMVRSGRHDTAFYKEFWRCLIEEGLWRGEIWNRRKSGEVYPEWLTINAVRSPDGGELHYVGVFTDITRIKQHEARLEQLANYDPLTELPNRHLLQERLTQTLAQTRRHGGMTALLSIDLDGFKTVNDSLGHPVGDELLLRVSQRLRNRLRTEDMLGRLGGDEFLVIAPALHEPADAAVLAQDLLAVIARPFSLGGGREAYVTASIGISLCEGHACGDATAMLRDADAALYRAKEQGRNCYSFYTQDMNAQAVAKLETEAALSRALPRGELRLHYQPKVSAASGRLTGAEALLRWQRDGELVPPGRFIPLAESSSLILDIGAWVIDEACRQWRHWADHGIAAPRIAVNVAARQFAAGNLDEVVTGALQRHGVPARALELELTESMLIDRPAESLALLKRLKGIGVTLALDDFGTGYSNLAYLRQFPIDTLKIDQTFVALIGEGHNGSAIVDAVIALAHRLGLGVVAEGVETEPQRAHLRAQGCDELQGYAIGRPVAAEGFETLCDLAATAADAGGPVSERG